MPQFFIDENHITGNTIRVRGDDLHHLLHVRRIKSGDGVQFRDRQGRLYQTVADDVSDDAVTCSIVSVNQQAETEFSLCLGAAILKGKKYDQVIQKAVEIGVDVIVPLLTERTIPDIGDKAEKKVQRWQRIALEASKQSLREKVPEVRDIHKYQDFIESCSDECKILAHVDPESTDLRSFLRRNEAPSSATILTGPEGGFSRKEVEIARRFDWNVLHTGISQFRAETAAMVLPAIILYEWGWR